MFLLTTPVYTSLSVHLTDYLSICLSDPVCVSIPPSLPIQLGPLPIQLGLASHV